MSSKNIRPILTAAVLAVTLVAAPALAAAPQVREHSAAWGEATLLGFWNNVSTWVAGWWSSTPPTVQPLEKTQSPAQTNCNGPAPGCAPPDPTTKVGSGIDPDGRPF